MSRHAFVPAEPLGNRPAVFSCDGDVWQRFGPAGTTSWWCARPDGSHRGRSWPEVCAISGDPPISIERPSFPDLAYTTDGIPVVHV